MPNEGGHEAGRLQLGVDKDFERAAAFAAEWKQVEKHVRRICSGQLDARDDLDDLVQLTAVRAWRGYSQYRRSSSFLTWVIAIARREVMRLNHQRRRQALRQVGVELADAVPNAQASADSCDWLQPAFAVARSMQLLSTKELMVVEERVALERWGGWREIASALGLSEAECALHYSRAIPKLRVLLFTVMPSALGGRKVIEQAYQAACQDKNCPLTRAEADAFRWEVLEAKAPPRRAGWQAALRGACSKVIRKIDH